MSRPPAESPIRSTEWTVDGTVLAHGGQTWEREFSGLRFDRLMDVAASPTPTGSVKMTFGTWEGRVTVRGELRATVDLVCQRCMSVMQYPVEEMFDLVLVDSEAEAPLGCESLEPWVANATHLNLWDVVEEQLLLALPLIPKHEDAANCVAATPQLAAVLDDLPLPQSASPPETGSDNGDVRRPFSQLRDLLNKS